MDLNIEVTVSTWRCPCHSNAVWGFFAAYAGCPITDGNYAGSKTYGTSYPTVADLKAAHPGVRPIGMDCSDWPALIEYLIADRPYRTRGGELVQLASSADV